MATYIQDQPLLLETVGRLYEAAANPELWPEALKTVAHLFDASKSQLSVYNSREASLSFAVLHGVNYGQEVVDRYAELSSTDPVSQAALRYPGKALRCSQLAGRDAIHDTQMYKEVLRPLGIEFRMVAIIGDQETQFCVLGLMRGREETEFDDDDVALLGDISPHFRRAMELYACLSAQQAGGKFALAALDTLSIGIAILDANSSVLFLNQAGNAIIDDQGGLVVRNGHLTAERAGEGNKLRQIVQQLTTGSEAASKFMTFVRSDGREPLPATISSFDRPPGLPVPLAQAYGLVIVIFTDPGRQLEVSWELLQRLYGLTPAESRLLAELVGGRSLVETADLLGITKETGRKRLSDVFQKTNTNRQAELVRHVLANPVWITEQAKRPALAHTPSPHTTA